MKTLIFIYEAVSRFQNVNEIILENGWGVYAYLITALAFVICVIASAVVLATRDDNPEADCEALKGRLIIKHRPVTRFSGRRGAKAAQTRTSASFLSLPKTNRFL